MKHNRRTAGFTTIVVVLFVLTLLLSIFIGYKLLTTKNSEIAPAAVDKTTAVTTTIPSAPETPAGYTTFSGTEFAFSFAYPSSYADIVKAPKSPYTTESTDMVYASESTTYPGIPMLVGGITVSVLKSGAYETYSRKYGPTIKLVNDKWIVAKTVASDDTGNKVGTEYTDPSKATIVATKKTNVTIYSLDSGDEGCADRRYAFLSYGRMVIISMPSFCSGEYGANENPTAEQTAAYKQILSNVLDSIWVGK